MFNNWQWAVIHRLGRYQRWLEAITDQPTQKRSALLSDVNKTSIINSVLHKYDQQIVGDLVKALLWFEKLPMAGKVPRQDVIDCIEGSSDGMGFWLFDWRTTSIVRFRSLPER
jgi:hypothetical protein